MRCTPDLWLGIFLINENIWFPLSYGLKKKKKKVSGQNQKSINQNYNFVSKQLANNNQQELMRCVLREPYTSQGCTCISKHVSLATTCKAEKEQYFSFQLIKYSQTS